MSILEYKHRIHRNWIQKGQKMLYMGIVTRKEVTNTDYPYKFEDYEPLTTPLPIVLRTNVNFGTVPNDFFIHYSKNDYSSDVAGGGLVDFTNGIYRLRKFVANDGVLLKWEDFNQLKNFRTNEYKFNLRYKINSLAEAAYPNMGALFFFVTDDVRPLQCMTFGEYAAMGYIPKMVVMLGMGWDPGTLSQPPVYYAQSNQTTTNEDYQSISQVTQLEYGKYYDFQLEKTSTEYIITLFGTADQEMIGYYYRKLSNVEGSDAPFDLYSTGIAITPRDYIGLGSPVTGVYGALDTELFSISNVHFPAYQKANRIKFVELSEGDKFLDNVHSVGRALQYQDATYYPIDLDSATQDVSMVNDAYYLDTNLDIYPLNNGRLFVGNVSATSKEWRTACRFKVDLPRNTNVVKALLCFHTSRYYNSVGGTIDVEIATFDNDNCPAFTSNPYDWDVINPITWTWTFDYHNSSYSNKCFVDVTQMVQESLNRYGTVDPEQDGWSSGNYLGFRLRPLDPLGVAGDNRICIWSYEGEDIGIQKQYYPNDVERVFRLAIWHGGTNDVGTTDDSLTIIGLQETGGRFLATQTETQQEIEDLIERVSDQRFIKKKNVNTFSAFGNSLDLHGDSLNTKRRPNETDDSYVSRLLFAKAWKGGTKSSIRTVIARFCGCNEQNIGFYEWQHSDSNWVLGVDALPDELILAAESLEPYEIEVQIPASKTSRTEKEIRDELVNILPAGILGHVKLY